MTLGIRFNAIQNELEDLDEEEHARVPDITNQHYDIVSG